MYKTIGLWFVVVLCLAIVVYLVYLVVSNAPREVPVASFQLYPWQEGPLGGYWILLVTFGLGVALVPMVRLLVMTFRQMRAEKRKRAARQAPAQGQE